MAVSNCCISFKHPHLLKLILSWILDLGPLWVAVVLIPVDNVPGLLGVGWGWGLGGVTGGDGARPWEWHLGAAACSQTINTFANCLGAMASTWSFSALLWVCEAALNWALAFPHSVPVQRAWSWLQVPYPSRRGCPRLCLKDCEVPRVPLLRLLVWLLSVGGPWVWATVLFRTRRREVQS